MQIDPIKPTLKAPGVKRLMLKYDAPLSTFALKLNLRRYIKVNQSTVVSFVGRDFFNISVDAAGGGFTVQIWMRTSAAVGTTRCCSPHHRHKR